MAAVYEYMGAERWDYVINLGDFMDFNCISRWTKDTPRLKMGETLQADYEYANGQLGTITKAARNKNPDCKIVFLEGNHDHRIEQYIDRVPELQGIMEMGKMLGFKKRGIKWVRCHHRGDTFKIGHAVFIHGLYCNKYHAAKHADQFGTCIFYGHTHDIQEYSKILQGDDSTIKGKSLGCLCEYNQVYIKQRPTRWQQAITVFYFYPDGYFQEQTAAIFKHRFVGPTNGVVYDGRKL
jgi:hypothetical protein